MSYVDRWDEGMHVAMDNTLPPDISTFQPRLVYPEARVLPDRECEVCGQPCQYPPECRDCATGEEAAAKRRADQ